MFGGADGFAAVQLADGGLGIQRLAVERLCYRIVQVAGQAVALLGHSRFGHHPGNPV